MQGEVTQNFEANTRRQADVAKIMAGAGGLEPPQADPESAVLPLDDAPTYVGNCCIKYYWEIGALSRVSAPGAV